MNSLTILLLATTAASLFTAWQFGRDLAAERQAHRHTERLADIWQAQRNAARAERDTAVEHADHATRTLRALLMDERPNLHVVEAGEGA